MASGYFPMHDDLQIMRLFELEKCFSVGQIPCRWAPDMAFGYGQAMFNFYSVFPYYLGILIRQLAQLSLIDSTKMLFAISLVLGGAGMYLLAKNFFGKSGAFISAVLYLFAPYRALNVYVRGALAESFSLALLPFLWLFIYKTIKKPEPKNVVLLSFALAFLLITHNISTLMYAIPTAIWTVYWLFRNLQKKSILGLFLGTAFGIGLSGFFLIPVIAETALTKDEIFTSGYSSYIAHYVSLNQIFISRFWDFGGSIFGDNDHMSFQLGWPHWWLGAGIGIYSLFRLIKSRKSIFLLVLGLLGVSALALFLTHSRSTFIWQKIPVLAFVQFPWRFVGLSVFLISLAGGALSLVLPGRIKYTLMLLVITSAILLNYQYFRPQMHFYEETDETKLSGELFYMQQQAAPSDYLPRTAKSAPISLAPESPEIVKGRAEISNFNKTSGTFFFDANVGEESVVDVPIIYFPGWKAYILQGQGQELGISPGGELGVIRLSLPKGNYMIEGRFTNTPARDIGNTVTVLSFIVLVSGFLITINKNETNS